MVINRAVALVAVWLGFGASVALAQQAPPAGGDARARAHFEAGTQAYDTGDYELAIREFRTAYDATGHPDLLYNIYLASERAGHLGEAEEALAKYLDEADVPDDRRPALEQRLARLQERREAQPEGERSGSPSEQAAPPAQGRAPEPEAQAPSGGGVSPVAVALLASAGALAVSFAVFAGLSEKEDGHLSDTCGTGCTDSQVSRLHAYNVAADVSWTVGLAAGATGLVLLFVLRDRGDQGDRDRASVTPSAWAGRDGGGLVLRGAF